MRFSSILIDCDVVSRFYFEVFVSEFLLTVRESNLSLINCRAELSAAHLISAASHPLTCYILAVLTRLEGLKLQVYLSSADIDIMLIHV